MGFLGLTWSPVGTLGERAARRASHALVGLLAACTQAPAVEGQAQAEVSPRPSFLLIIADDWGWPHAGVAGDPVVRTPSFDRLAREGVLFTHAFASAPSCTPSRAALLTGQWHWRLEGVANLWGEFPDRFATYPEILGRAGYAVGMEGRNWGPGTTQNPERRPEGPEMPLAEFLSGLREDQPFCFWLGSLRVHRPYAFRSGAAAGIDLDAIRLPSFFPNARIVRNDVADYYAAVQAFDAEVGAALALLEQHGRLASTLVVVTSDNGWPFPRGKSNGYDAGVRVPLAMRWGEHLGPGRVIEDFVSLTDLAPTFLELAGVPVPPEMTGRSLAALLTSGAGRVEPARDHVLFGKERHVPAQEAPDLGGYPIRALRTREFLYLRNFRPERWPNGSPEHERTAIPGLWYGDIDNGPTKLHLVRSRDWDEHHRPAEELYDLARDPEQLVNVAADPAYAETKARLASQLARELEASGDPRQAGHGERFDQYPYRGSGARYPGAVEGEGTEGERDG